MSEVKFPDDFEHLPVVVVKADSPALHFLIKRAYAIKPGAIVPATEEEIESLRKDVVVLKT